MLKIQLFITGIIYIFYFAPLNALNAALVSRRHFKNINLRLLNCSACDSNSGDHFILHYLNLYNYLTILKYLFKYY